MENKFEVLPERLLAVGSDPHHHALVSNPFAEAEAEVAETDLDAQD